MVGTGYQSDLVVFPTPFLVHRSSQLLCKELLVIERYLIPHDIIGCPIQLVGQGTVSDHEIRFCLLTIIISSGIWIITPGEFSCFGVCPSQVFVAVFLIAFALCLTVAGPFRGHLPTVRDVVTYPGKPIDATGLQHDRQR